MEHEQPEDYKQWRARMIKLQGYEGKTLSEKQKENFNFGYRSIIFYDLAVPSLKDHLFKYNLILASAPEDFSGHINTLISITVEQVMERMWQIVNDSRKGISPEDITELQFETLPAHLEKIRIVEPAIETVADYRDDEFFNALSAKDQQEFLQETNESNFKSWKYCSTYCHDFIECLQPLIMYVLPELIEIESKWWLVYEHYLINKHVSLKDKAGLWSHVIKSGLSATWLDAKYSDLDKKLQEISQQKQSI